MASRVLRVLLALSILVASPGGSGWVLFAQNAGTYTRFNAQTGQPQVYNVDSARARVVNDFLRKLNDPKLRRQVSQESITHVQNYARSYLSGATLTPEVEALLKTVVQDLNNSSKDKELTLARIYENSLTNFARNQSELGNYTVIRSQSEENSVVELRSRATGNLLLVEDSKEVAYKTHLKIIRRPHPGNIHEEIIDAIILETKRGAATEPKVIYNSRLERMFKDIVKAFYELKDLERQFNDEKDPLMKPKARQELKRIYEGKRKEFLEQTRVPKFDTDIIGYLAKLEQYKVEGRLAELDPEELEAVQKVASKFYNAKQLDEMQKRVILGLVNYFSLVTNTAPRTKKDGKQDLDPLLKKAEDIQKMLTAYNEGKLEGYGKIMEWLGATKLSEEQRSHIDPKMLPMISQTMAAVAHAVKAKGRAFQTGLSLQEFDAAIEESQHWLQLAQMQWQSFELTSMAIQIEKLSRGQMRGRMGLDKSDTGMKNEAQRLASAARQQYLLKLNEAALEARKSLLKQAVAGFYMTHENAVNAYLYDDTLRERVRMLSAKASQMHALFLAAEFDKVKGNFMGRTALERLGEDAYKSFLQNMGPRTKAESLELEQFAKEIKDLENNQSVEYIRDRLESLFPKFRELVRRLGLKEIPDLKGVRKDADLLAIKHGKISAATQNFSLMMSLFDRVNQLDISLIKEASSENVKSDSDTFASYLWSFKWLEKVYGAAPFRNRLVRKGMQAWDLEAWDKLGKNEHLRKQVLEAFRRSDYAQAVALIQGLDSGAKEKAQDSYQNLKPGEDPFKNLDFETFMTSLSGDSSLMIAAGVIEDQFKFQQRFALSYALVSAGVDFVITAALTAGIGQVFGYAAQLASGGAARIIQLSAAGQGGAAMLGAARGITVAKSFAKWPGIRNLLALPKSWSSNFKHAADFAEMPAQLNKGQWLGHAVKQYFKQGLLNGAKSTFGGMVIMSGASAAIETTHHWMGPETSPYRDGWDALHQGSVRGAAFGSKASMIWLFSPFPSTIFGAGVSGNIARSVANTPGLFSGSWQWAAKLARPAGAVAEIGPYGALSKWAVGRGLAARGFSKGAIYLGANADGILKFYLAGEVPATLVQLGHFYGTGAAPEQAGASGYVGKLARAQDVGVVTGQGSWLAIPINPQTMSSRQIKASNQQMGAISYMLRKGRGLKLETSTEISKITEQKRPWYLRTWSDWIHGNTVMEVPGGGEVQKQAIEFRNRREMLKSELIAGAVATSKDHGKSTTVGKLRDSLRTGEIEIVERDGDKALEADQRLVTNEGNPVYKDILKRELFKSESWRQEILQAKDEYKFVDIDLRGRSAGAGQEVPVKGAKLEELKSIAANAEIESRGAGRAAPRLLWERAKDTVTGRSLTNKFDLLVRRAQDGIREASPEQIQAAADHGLKETSRALKAAALDGKAAEAAGAIESTAAKLETIADRYADSGFIQAAKDLRKMTGEIALENKHAAKTVEKAAAKIEEMDVKILVAERAKHILESASGSAQRLIDSHSGTYKAALEQTRKGIESAAYSQYVKEKLVDEFKSYERHYKALPVEKRPVSIKDYEQGGPEERRLLELVRLYTGIWEMGIFGRIFGEKKFTKKVDGKEAPVEPYYEIPPQFQFKDYRNRSITEFNALQEEMIVKNLLRLAEGKRMIFDLLSTGGGKTLLGFVMLDFFQTYGRREGKEGAYFVTTTGELVAQAQEAYSAFFKGRKPPFEIITYSDLMARLGEADSSGGLSPFQTHSQYWDEADKPGMETALALGQDSGRLSHSQADPVFPAFYGDAKKIGISAVLTREFVEKGKDASAGLIFDPKDAGTNMDRNAFRRKLSKDAEFRGRYNEWLDRTVAAVEQARLSVKRGEFGAAKQIAVEIGKQHRNAFGTWHKMGVIERKHGNVRNWVEERLEGAYVARTQKDLSKFYKYDAKRNKVYMIHNDTVYESLETELREVMQIIFAVPLDLPYDTVNITNYRRLNEAARDAKTPVVGGSGSLADGMFRFMIHEADWYIQGKGTELPPYKTLVLADGRSFASLMTKATKAAHAYNKALERKREHEPIKADEPGGKRFVWAYADSPSELKKLEEDLDAAGHPKNRRSIIVQPGTDFFKQTLHEIERVEKEKNEAGIEAGTVDIVITVGQDGLRGLDRSFEKYAEGRMDFFTGNPEILALVSQKQLFGRTLGGKRVPGSTHKNYYLAAESRSLRQDKAYAKVTKDLITKALGNQDAKNWDTLSRMLDKKVPAGKTLEQSIKEIIADPMLFEARQLYAEYTAVRDLKDYLAKAASKEAAGNGMIQARLKELLADDAKRTELSLRPEMFKILISEMQLKAELEAMEASGVNKSRATQGASILDSDEGAGAKAAGGE